jgi:nucleotide-binding universal stress UspA family protein
MTLLVAVSSEHDEISLVEHARALATAAGWELRGVHVNNGGGAGPAQPTEGPRGLEVLELSGDPVAELERIATEASVDALALGLSETAGGDESALGHVTRALLEQMPAPLLLVRPGMRKATNLKRLIVPLEGSPSTSAAMQHADDALCARGREIVMLHVVTRSTPDEPGSMPAPRIVDQEHYEWSSWQEEFCMRFSQCPEGGRHRVCLRVGEPAQVIADEARELDAELIVVSWKGSFAHGHGRIVQALIESAPCALLVVPGER